MVEDAILNEIWGDQGLLEGEVEFQGPYGVGRWPDAVLMDVDTIDEHDYGYRVKLTLNLKGEEGMKFTTRLDLPRSPTEEKFVSMTERVRNNLATVLTAGGLLPAGKLPGNVDDDADYERIVTVFRHAIGRNIPISVRQQRKLNKETNKWENTDFTEIIGLKPRK